MIKFINVNLVQDRRVRPVEILVKDSKIAKITPAGGLSDVTDALVIDGNGRYVSHGFVDIHVHGGGGHDFMDGTKEAYEGAALLHAKFGTTDMVPTTLAASNEELFQTFATYEKYKNDHEGARFLGLHLEGPYLSPAQGGAQDPKYIRAPKKEEYARLVEACPDIIRWTIAPEIPGALEMAEYLRSHDITPSMGHTDATIDEVKLAVKHGFNHITHLYSCCSTIVRRGGYRFPGVIESAYLIDDLTVEVIADGCHLPASLLEMVYRFIGPDRTTMVTDSSRGSGMPEGESILGSLENGQKVIIDKGVAWLPDRSAFAGSVATTDRLVRSMIDLAKVPLPVAVDMLTRVAAKIIGREDKVGTLKEGADANLILFDETIHVSLTMVGGKLIFKEGIRL